MNLTEVSKAVKTIWTTRGILVRLYFLDFPFESIVGH